MPRGVRAVHGAEVDGSYHSHAGGGLVAFYAPADLLLEVRCWCERSIVLVPQREIRYLGLTRACTAPRCASPGGDDTQGVVVRMHGFDRSPWRIFKWESPADVGRLVAIRGRRTTRDEAAALFGRDAVERRLG